MIKSVKAARGTIVIREASLADVEQFRELRLFALKDSPTSFSADYNLVFGLPTSYWEDRLRPNKYGTMFFAENNSKLVGMMGIRKSESPKTEHGAGIWGVFIRPEWRGMRIAEEMINLSCEWAKLRKVQIVRLAVVSTNESAIRLYERCGFTVYGTEPRVLFYENKYYDEYLMSRSLIDP